MRFGAIDIGTNAARLLVGEVSVEGKRKFVKKLGYNRVPLRLGEEVFENGKISKKKSEEFIKTMKAFKLIAEVFGVEGLRACATSAMREAENGVQVRDMIAKKTGVNIDIISGDEESDLIFGTFSLLNIDNSVPYVVIDVGGGSTEVNVFEHGQRVASKSFKVGTLRLLKGKVAEDIWKEIHDWLASHVEMDTLHHFYATGGNINKVQKMVGVADRKELTIEKIKSIRKVLGKMTVEERMERFSLKPDRADVIVPALDIYLYIMKELACERVIVPKIGLADGMVYQMYMDQT